MGKLFIMVVVVLALFLGVAGLLRLAMGPGSNHPNNRIEEADARGRIGALIRGDPANVVDGLPAALRPGAEKRMAAVHRILGGLGPYGGAKLARARIHPAGGGVLEVGLDYRLVYPHHPCTLHFTYEDRPGVPPRFRGVGVFGDCARAPGAKVPASAGKAPASAATPRRAGR